MIKKICIKTIKALTVILVIFISIFIGLSYSIYKNVITDDIINNKINTIISQNGFVEYEDINQTFLDAIVAIEDHRFYYHIGVDPIAIGRAVLVNIENKEIIEGGSTITQQLVKNLFLTNEKTYERKMKEIVIALKLEHDYTKEEILELYVNAIYYGNGYTGIKDACLGYFNKVPSEITENEATLLAGLPQAPSLYSLTDNYAAALERQVQVIDALKKFNNR